MRQNLTAYPIIFVNEQSRERQDNTARDKPRALLHQLSLAASGDAFYTACDALDQHRR
jgi:hypothetical protein